MFRKNIQQVGGKKTRRPDIYKGYSGYLKAGGTLPPKDWLKLPKKV